MLGVLTALKDWVAKNSQTFKRLETLSTCLSVFDLYCPMEIEALKVSSKIGKMLKKPVSEVVLDLYLEEELGKSDCAKFYLNSLCKEVCARIKLDFPKILINTMMYFFNFLLSSMETKVQGAVCIIPAAVSWC